MLKRKKTDTHGGGMKQKGKRKKSPGALQLLPKDTLHQVIIHHSDSPPSSDETRSSAGAPPPPPFPAPPLLPALLPKILEQGPARLPYLPRCDYILSVNPRYKGCCGSLHSRQLGFCRRLVGNKNLRFWFRKKRKPKNKSSLRKLLISNSGSLQTE